MAGQLATASFDHQHPQAPDNRMQRPNLNARNEISPWIRWEGMQVYVVQEQKTYQLVGGTGNEHWQEIAAGGGASNFVGQFPTFDDLPNSGSPGDYAYVGTGDDFVQYNWDQIAGEWRLNSAETKVSDEDFFLGRVPSEPDRVMFSMRRNSIIYSTGGTQSISPDRMANYVFTGENVTLENVNYDTEGNEEFHITNRTGSNLTILGTGNFASGLTIPAGHMASFKSSNDGWVQSFVNEEATFSDTLDSVNAKISTGPDGKDVLSGIVNKDSGVETNFKEVTGFSEDLIDGVSVIKVNSKLFASSNFFANREINLSDYGVAGDGVTDDSLKIQKAIDTLHEFGGGVLNFPASRTFLVSMQGEVPYKSTDTGVLRDQDFCLLIRSRVVLNLNGSTLKMQDSQNAAIFANASFDYTETPDTGFAIINGILDSNGGNQQLATGGSTLSTITFQNANFFRLEGLQFTYSKETAVKLTACDFVIGVDLDIRKCEGNGFRIGAFTPTQVHEGRVRYSFFDKLRAKDTLGGFVGIIQGSPLVACATFTSFGSVQFKNNGAGIKLQEGCLHLTVGQAIIEGPDESEYIEGVNASKNSGLKIQGGSFLDYPPKYIAVGELVCKNQYGSGLLMEYSEDCTVSTYVGHLNDVDGDRGDVRIGNSLRSKVLSIGSSEAGGSGIQLQPTAFDTVIDQALVTNPCRNVGKSGVQVWGGSSRLGTFIIRDNREIPRMLRAFDLNDVDAEGNLQYLIASGWVTSQVRHNSPAFTIFRKTTESGLDEISIPELVARIINAGDNVSGNSDTAITGRSYSGIAISGISITGPGVRGGSQTGPGGLFVGQGGPGSRSASQNGSGAEGSSQTGPGGLFTSREGHAIDVLQFETPALNQASAAARIRRTFTTDGGVNAGAPTLDVNDAAVASGPRNNPILNLRWDNVIKFQVDKDGRITVGNIREDRVENATNPLFVAGDRIKFLRLTGAAGNGQVPGGVYEAGVELQGEVEGGAKTFVGTSGLTLRYPAGGTNVAPTNSRFFIKFKSPNDAQLTIVPSVIPENTYDTFIPAINGSTSNPTVSYTDQFGDYALIDKLCHFELRLNWQSLSGGTGNIRIPLPIPRLRNTANGGPAIAVMTGLSTSPPIYACYSGFNNIGFRNAAGNEISVLDLESEGVIALSGTYIIGE